MTEPRASRIDIDTYFMFMAKIVSLRSTCKHREQGAVIVRDNHIVATGYNGSPPGQLHCIDLEWCMKEQDQLCRAEGLHGESNAVAWAAREGVATNGAIVYCLFSPCKACCNLLKSAGVVEVRYLEVYDGFDVGPEYLRSIGIKEAKVRQTEVLTWKLRQT